MPSPVIQFKRGLSSGITSFKAGEPAFTTDTFDFYIGADNTLANNKFFGSHRYWTKENGSKGSGVNLVEATGGSDFITLAAPASVGAAVTYYFPATQGAVSSVLTNDGNGNLTWASGSQNATFTGITTFSDTTDSTTQNNGSVIFEGGVGIEKSVNIGGNLKVSGISTFVGSVTFEGGTINLGDANTDDINVAGEFISNLVPNTSVTYDVGTSTKRWATVYTRDLSVSGVSTFTGITTFQNGVNIDGLVDIVGHLDVIGAMDVDDLRISGITTIGGRLDGNGSLEIDGDVKFNSGLIVTGVTTTNGAIDANGALSVDGVTTLNGNLVSAGFSTFQSAVTMNSTLAVSGNTTLSGALGVTGIATFSNNVNVTGSADVTGNLRVSGITTIGDASADTLTVNATTTFVEPVVGTIGTATRANNVDVAGVAVNQNYYVTLVDGSGNSKAVGVDAELLYNPNTNKMTVPTINVGQLNASDGVSAISLTSSTGDVGITSSLTVNGNLYVLGSTTEVNTQTLKVEDSLIEVGLVNSSGVLVPPSSDLNIDIGVLFNWYSGSARKASVYWDDSAQRVGIASDVTEVNGVLTANAYAGVEIGSLWVTDCAGTSQVISCTGSERFLNNITIDAGTF